MYLGQDAMLGHERGAAASGLASAMTDESHRLLLAGPEAVLLAIARGADGLHLDGLAMACSRVAREASAPREEALRWAEACIACYEVAAKSRIDGWDRQGSEVPSFSLRVSMMLRWGVEAGHPVLDPTSVFDWVQVQVVQHTDPATWVSVVRGDEDGERESAICLRERLYVAHPLKLKGLGPRSLEPWFRAYDEIR